MSTIIAWPTHVTVFLIANTLYVRTRLQVLKSCLHAYFCLDWVGPANGQFVSPCTHPQTGV